jgi:thymidylate kinase
VLLMLYIAIEGIKGCGKSTAHDLAHIELKGRGMQVVSFKPTAARRGCIIDTLFNRTGSYWPDALRKHLYACRSKRATQLLTPTSTVLGERSIFTSYVTRWDYSNPAEGIAKAQRSEPHLPVPDHVIYLDVPVNTAIERISARRRRGYGALDETEARLYEADRLYKYLADNGTRHAIKTVWTVIDATREMADVVNQIVTFVESHIARPATSRRTPTTS